MAVSTSPHATTDTAGTIARLLDEQPIGMSAAARMLGAFRGGRPTHPSTRTRWANAGVALPDGRVIRLEAVRVNGRLLTSKPALIRFIAQQQPAAASEGDAVQAVRAPAKRNRASEQAAAELEKLGC